MDPLDPSYPRNPGIVEDIRSVLLATLALFRGEMARGGSRDASVLLEDAKRSEEFIRLVGARVEIADAPALLDPARRQPPDVPEDAAMRHLSLLTWNVAGDALACTAPSSWSLRDK